LAGSPPMWALRSASTTRAPSLAAAIAAQIPAGVAPMMHTCVWSVIIDAFLYL
jgi:hypothetical protein